MSALSLLWWRWLWLWQPQCQLYACVNMKNGTWRISQCLLNMSSCRLWNIMNEYFYFLVWMKQMDSLDSPYIKRSDCIRMRCPVDQIYATKKIKHCIVGQQIPLNNWSGYLGLLTDWLSQYWLSQYWEVLRWSFSDFSVQFTEPGSPAAYIEKLAMFCCLTEVSVVRNHVVWHQVVWLHVVSRLWQVLDTTRAPEKLKNFQLVQL